MGTRITLNHEPEAKARPDGHVKHVIASGWIEAGYWFSDVFVHSGGLYYYLRIQR